MYFPCLSLLEVILRRWNTLSRHASSRFSNSTSSIPLPDNSPSESFDRLTRMASQPFSLHRNMGPAFLDELTRYPPRAFRKPSATHRGSIILAAASSSIWYRSKAMPACSPRNRMILFSVASCCSPITGCVDDQHGPRRHDCQGDSRSQISRWGNGIVMSARRSAL